MNRRRLAPKLVFGALAALVLFWIANTLWHDGRLGYAAGGWPEAFRAAPQGLRAMRFGISMATPDLTAGAAAVAIAGLALAYRIADRGRTRSGEEHGSARWGRPSDIAPLTNNRPERNLLLTRTERLTLDRPKKVEHMRNLNVMCIGAAGSGKSRFFIMPNIDQAQSSMLVTDPKGELLASCGVGLSEAGYTIKVFNVVDFAASDRFNPLAYLRPGHEPEDVGLMVRNIMANTDNGKQNAGGDQFWEKAEAGLLNALISFIAATYPEPEQHLGSVVDLLGQMQASDDDLSPVDALFASAVEALDDDPHQHRAELLRYGVANYRIYQQAATKTAASIIVTTAVRLAPLHIPSVRRLVTGDTLELDMLGFRKTALFMVISDVDKQFSWLASLVFTVFFQRGVYLADRQADRRLPVPVQCWMDEFANIGRIPDFDILAATLRSRGISFAAVIQNIGQGQNLYKDGWKAILGNCDTVLFLGSADADTKDYISKALGKETIQVTDSSRSRGRQGNYSTSRKSHGRELLTPDEVGRIRGNEAIVLIRGLPPFRSRKLSAIPENTIYRHRPTHTSSAWA